MKKNKKVVITLLTTLVCLLVCAGVIIGTQYFGNKEPVEVDTPKKTISTERTKNEKCKYTIVVKDCSGSPVKGALVAFYDKDDNMITEPTATSSVGSTVYTVDEEGNYGVSILSVPFRYALDSTIRKFEDGQTTIQVVLEDNPNAILAQINGVNYVLEDAVKIANASEEDVTITLLGDVTISALSINNAAGKKITIDGNGYTLTTLGGSNAITVNQKSGTIELKNMTIDHKNAGQVIKMNYAVTLNLENMKIVATHDQKDAYKYCLINFMGEGTSNLNMTKVDVLMATTSEGSEAGVIRTGNTDTPKHVNITMKGCNIDVTEASGRCGIIVMDNCTANINLSGTTIMTMDTYAIKPNGRNLTYTEDCVFGSKDEWYNTHPIEEFNVQIGDKWYTLAGALKVANASEEDVTIKFGGDVAYKGSVSINNKYGKNITIDGCNYTLTAADTSHFIKIQQTSGTVTIQNMNINHSGTNMLLRIGQNRKTENATEVTTVNLSNLNITSTSTYKYCLMATQDYKTFHVNMSNVNVDWDTDSAAVGSSGFFRVSNGEYEQELYLTMKDCLIDLSDASGRKGIYVVKKAVGDITLLNTTIITQGVDAIYKNKMNVTTDELCEFNADGGNCHAKIGDTIYLSLARALAVANESEEDVTIELINDVTLIGSVEINNKNGKHITIEGSGYTLKATATEHSLQINQTSGVVTIQNLNVEHSGSNMLMRIGDNGKVLTTNELTVNLSNVDITSTGTYQYCLIGTQGPQIFNVNMTNVNADWDKECTQKASAFIRCGGSTEGQTLNLTMKDCVINVADADLTQGIYVHTTVTDGEINLQNTTFITLDAATYTNKGSIKVNADDECVFNTDGGEAQVKIGEETYLSLGKAVSIANSSEEDITIELLKDITVMSSVEFDNVYGKNITLDGNGYTLTAESTDHFMKVHQASGAVTIQNMNIVHSGTKMLIRLGDNTWDDGTIYGVIFNMKDVNIASSGTYQYCLIATQDPGAFDLNMTNVTVDWDKEGTQKMSALIRCGGNANYEHTVNLVMTGCTIDVSDAALTQCVYVTAGAIVNITSDENTTITTAEGISGYTKEAKTEEAFLEALTFANASKEDVTIKLTGDITHTNNSETVDNAAIINNVYGKHVIIEGNGKTLTTSCTYNNKRPDLRIDQSNGMVTIQNLVISHSGKSMLLRIGADGETPTEDNLTVNLTNIDITSTGTYKYCLIGTQGPQTFNVNMTDVTVDWNGQYADSNGNGYASRAFARCGGSTKGQTLNLTMTDCVINVVDAAPTQGLYIHTTVTGGTVNLYNTDIITLNSNTYTNKVTDVTINADENSSFETDGGAQAKIGDTSYSSFAKAVEAANASEEDVTIQLLRDVVIDVPTNDDAVEINNANGKNITIDGCGYTLDVTSTKHAIRIHQTSGTVTIQNCNIVHSGAQMLMRIGENGSVKSTDELTVNLSNIDITSTGTYQYCLIGTQGPQIFNVNMTDVKVEWEKACTQKASAFIRCGGTTSGQTLNLTMTDCVINVANAELTQGLYIHTTVTGGTINLYNTDIITLDADSYTNKVTSVTINADENCDFNTNGGVETSVAAVLMSFWSRLTSL